MAVGLAGCRFGPEHPLHGQTWFSAASSKGLMGASFAQAGGAAIFVSADHPAVPRAHSAAAHKKLPHQALIFARRPGTQAYELDFTAGEYRLAFHCDEGRHLLGHGCYSADGHYLFTTELDIATGQGLVIVRRADNYSVVDEFFTQGIGPHEIKLMPDGKRLVVANGGLLTHPDSGRAVLNLDSMDSSLVYLDANTGQVLEQERVPEAKASIRHLDVADDGTVVVAMQMQRKAAQHNNTGPLAALHKSRQRLRLGDQPEAVIDQFNDYAGSAVINNATGSFAITSPRGNLAAFWSMRGEFLGAHHFTDVCGVALTREQDYFVLSSSVGQLRFIDASTYKEALDLRITTLGIHWDNHLLRGIDHV
jgi:hypothetical protein